jgi:hypothetical protein
MPFIGYLRLWVPVWSPILIGLDFPPAALIDITKRRKILTCTQDTTRAKVERLCSTKLICHDSKATKLDMQGFK